MGLFSIGLYMTGLDYYDPLYHKLPWWHKSFGLLTLFLLVFRVLWTFINLKPKALETHKKWEIKIANWIKRIFYFLILIIVLSGYLISTAKGKGIEFFTLFKIPAITPEIEADIADLIGLGHKIMAITLALLVALHILAALKHHFIDKDKTLKRMIND